MRRDPWLDAFDGDDFADPDLDAVDGATERLLGAVDRRAEAPVDVPDAGAGRPVRGRSVAVAALLGAAIVLAGLGLVDRLALPPSVTQAQPSATSAEVGVPAATDAPVVVPPRPVPPTVAPAPAGPGLAPVDVPVRRGSAVPVVAAVPAAPPAPKGGVPAEATSEDRLHLRDGADVTRQGALATLHAGLVDVDHTDGGPDPVRVRLAGLSLEAVPLGTSFTVGLVDGVGMVAVRDGTVALRDTTGATWQTIPAGRALLVGRDGHGALGATWLDAVGLERVWEVADAAGADPRAVVRLVSRLRDEEAR
ncbi:MAG: hypothetical protein H6733_11330 [Alphaproteobacteria bacterium]|nr:hypothetical protein [Alphaproteobacteria bacterium]